MTQLLNPNGKTDKPVVEEFETAFLVYLTKEGGSVMFNNSIVGVPMRRQATYDDVFRMCSDVVSEVQSLRTVVRVEKLMDIKDKIRKGEIKLELAGKNGSPV